jgi:hypothetical protein
VNTPVAVVLVLVSATLIVENGGPGKAPRSPVAASAATPAATLRAEPSACTGPAPADDHCLLRRGELEQIALDADEARRAARLSLYASRGLVDRW